MPDSDKVFAGSIPDMYDTYLVPLIFEPYAADLAARVAAFRPTRVLETAAGSGVVPRALAPMLAPETRYVVTDLNQPMLDRARSQQPHGHVIEWQQADAMALPFDDATFDVVCCQFGVMFLPDMVAGFQEARRVLKAGGHFIFNVWDRIEENEFADCVTNTVSGMFPDNPPVFLARTPHGHYDTKILEQKLVDAGFAQVKCSTLPEQSRAESPQVASYAYCQGTPLRTELVDRSPDDLDRITDIAAADLAERFGSKDISGKIQAHIFVATR